MPRARRERRHHDRQARSPRPRRSTRRRRRRRPQVLTADPPHPYVSRGGLKLEHALNTFGLDVTGLRCADLGASVGGFTDCLLQHGAAHVTAVDTAYGILAWKLRSDDRVTPVERTNALHASPPEHPVDLVVIDLGWTPQARCLPVASNWTANRGTIVTLIKPHYELADAGKPPIPKGGILPPEQADDVAAIILEQIDAAGYTVRNATRSPLKGSKGKKDGNIEWLAHLEHRE